MKPVKFLKCLAMLQKATKPRIEASQISCLIELYRAGEQGLQMGDIARVTGLTAGAAGRMARGFTVEGWTGVKQTGHGLAEIYYNPRFPKSNMVRLNIDGKLLVEDFLTALEGADTESEVIFLRKELSQLK